MPNPYTYWIFCDESGNLSNPDNRYLIGVAGGTENPDMLKRATNRIYQEHRYAIRKGKPLHAAELNPKIVRNFLKQIAKIENLALFITILDKQWLWDYKKDRDDIYNELFANLIQQGIAIQDTKEAHTLIVLERRDSYKKYMRGLISKIEKYTSLDESQIKLCSKNDAEWGKQLQIADAIAWSTYQKYEKQDSRFVDILTANIQLETVLGIDGTGIMRPISEMNN